MCKSNKKGVLIVLLEYGVRCATIYVSGGQPTKGAVNIVDIVGVNGGRPTKVAVNIVDIVGVSGDPLKAL